MNFLDFIANQYMINNTIDFIKLSVDSLDVSMYKEKQLNEQTTIRRTKSHKWNNDVLFYGLKYSDKWFYNKNLFLVFFSFFHYLNVSYICRMIDTQINCYCVREKKSEWPFFIMMQS